jgi:hypothetical protein
MNQIDKKRNSLEENKNNTTLEGSIFEHIYTIKDLEESVDFD